MQTLAPSEAVHSTNGYTASPETMELKHRLHSRLLERINLDRLASIDAPRMRREVRQGSRDANRS